MRVSGLSGGAGLSSVDVSVNPAGGGAWLPSALACGGCVVCGGVVCCWVGGC